MHGEAAGRADRSQWSSYFGRATVKISIKTILCPVDFSRAAAHATRYALTLAELSSAQVVLVHIDEPSVGYTCFDSLGIDGYVPISTVVTDAEPPTAKAHRPKGNSAPSLERLAEQFGSTHESIRIVPVRMTGKPSLQIVEAARKHQADLIVLGARRHSGVSRVLTVHTVEKVLRMASCPVLVVKPPLHPSVSRGASASEQ